MLNQEASSSGFSARPTTNLLNNFLDEIVPQNLFCIFISQILQEYTFSLNLLQFLENDSSYKISLLYKIGVFFYITQVS